MTTARASVMTLTQERTVSFFSLSFPHTIVPPSSYSLVLNTDYPLFTHMHDEQHRCMGLNSHGVSKVSVIDAAGVKQVEHR